MFTPVNTSIGALLLFSGSFGLLLHNGRVFGISSMLRTCLLNPSLCLPRKDSKSVRGDDDTDQVHDVHEDENFPALAGLITAPLLVKLVAPSLLPSYPDPTGASTFWVSAAAILGTGILTGWGTKVGSVASVFSAT